SWQLKVSGETVAEGRIAAHRIAPGESQGFALPLPKTPLAAGQEAFLDLQFIAARASGWCPVGHSLGWDQVRIAGRPLRQVRPVSRGVAQWENVRDAIVVSGEAFDIR